MTAAASKTRARSETKLLVATSREGSTELTHLPFKSLPLILRRGDLLVINDAATLPASFSGSHLRTGLAIEMRLASSRLEELAEPIRWNAIFFGRGNWRTPTELRSPPPELQSGDELEFGHGLRAKVRRVLSQSGRMAEIEFEGEPSVLWHRMYLAGRPVQYSHLREDLDLWDVQTVFSGPPVSLEAPSAAFPLSWEIVFELERKGIQMVRLTHAAGLSATGDPEIDAELPFPERYWIPDETAEAVNQARGEGRRVIAVGTTVTRALESAVHCNGVADGTVRPGPGIATLKMTPSFQRQVVSGILSGFHDSGASHLQMLGSFMEPATLAQAYREAEEQGYLAHEFGDSCLILTQPRGRF